MLRNNPIAKNDNVKTLCDSFYHFSRKFYETRSTPYRPHPKILEDWNLQLFVEKKQSSPPRNFHFLIVQLFPD